MKKVVIIGAGVAGVYASIKIKQAVKDCEVIILEANKAPLKKLLATGNGRCNLSNRDLDLRHYDGHMTEEIGTAITTFRVQEELKKLGLETKYQEALLYPLSEQAAAVRDVLLEHTRHLGIKIFCEEFVANIKKEGQFIVTTNQRMLKADFCVLACGSQAGGQSGRHNREPLLDQLCLAYRPFAPSLTKMITKENVHALKGVRVKGVFELKSRAGVLAKEKGELLFTDYGLSGIAVMNLSRYYQPGASLTIDMLPDYPYQELRRIIAHSPLTDPLLGIVSEKLAQYRQRHSIDPITFLKKFSFQITGLKGYDDAQVVKGGVLLDTLTPALEARNVPGLYCLGELLDVTGDCGGYNLHFALTSAYLAAHDIVEAIKVNRE